MKSKKEELSIILPKHIAFIMDGNGRWATARLLPRSVGHSEGVKTLERIVDEVFALGIPYISLYAFSTENRNRPENEVKALFKLIENYFVKSLDKFVNKGIRILFMGDLSYFPEKISKILYNTMEKSKACSRGTLNIGLNYGGRAEIVRAANEAVEQGLKIDEQCFSKLLYTCDMPDPDLLIRPGGEMRLSNFLLYQCAYSELFFTKTLWPDFNKKELMEILTEYSNRNRKFGKI